MSFIDLWSWKYSQKLVFWDRKTMLKHLLNSSKTSLKKSRIRNKMAKNDLLKCQKCVTFWLKISILEVIYRPLELKNNPKVDPLRPKRMPKLFKNNFQITLKNIKVSPKNTPRPSTNPPSLPLTLPTNK